MSPDARDLARMVSIPQVLRHLGWRIRHRKRADCGLCRGNSTGTVAFTERLWKCHRCNEGGDVFKLIMAVNRCGFRDALAYVAGLAGVLVENARRDDWRRNIAEHQRKMEHIGRAAQKLGTLERALRLECRDRIHECDRVLAIPGPWREAQWQRAQAACLFRDECLLAYTVLCFAAVAERARYILYPDRRLGIIAAARYAGGVRSDEGQWIGVLR